MMLKVSTNPWLEKSDHAALTPSKSNSAIRDIWSPFLSDYESAIWAPPPSRSKTESEMQQATEDFGGHVRMRTPLDPSIDEYVPNKSRAPIVSGAHPHEAAQHASPVPVQFIVHYARAKGWMPTTL